MATTITYTAKEQKLQSFGWQGGARVQAAARAVKMVRPICSECQVGEFTVPGWFKTCDHGPGPGGSPYWSLQPKVRKIPKTGVDEDGDMVLLETEVRTKLVLMPNMCEVVLNIRQNSGQSVEMALRKGYKFLADEGIAPMCQLYGCGKTFPTVNTAYGDFCSEMHGKVVAADANEEILISVQGSNSPKANQAARKQLSEIVV
jgi:hypothetical protein